MRQTRCYNNQEFCVTMLAMSNIDSINNKETSWSCPVCNASGGASGLFVSDWSVACHIAGKARTGDRLHKSWALSKISDLDVKATLPKIAERLTWAVVEAQREQELKESLQNQRLQGPYERISSIEKRLHKFLENTLKREYRESEDGWWVKGLPLPVRQKCVNRREEAMQRQDPYAYTDLIDLQSILNNNWRSVEVNFQRISKQCKSKNEFLNSLGKLNEIRKVIFHPVREQDQLSSEETQFLDWFDNLAKEFISGD